MKCPFCGAPLATVAGRCASCAKEVNLDEAAAVGQVDYLLAELDTWNDLLPAGLLANLRGRYAERREVLRARLAGGHEPQMHTDKHR